MPLVGLFATHTYKISCKFVQHCIITIVRSKLCFDSQRPEQMTIAMGREKKNAREAPSLFATCPLKFTMRQHFLHASDFV